LEAEKLLIQGKYKSKRVQNVSENVSQASEFGGTQYTKKSIVWSPAIILLMDFSVSL
jgi:hypothetical protein